MNRSTRSRVATFFTALASTLALSLLAACSANDSSDDTSAEITTLVTAACQHDMTCRGMSGSSVNSCVENFASNPVDCPASQEENCLELAAALPCNGDAGSPQALAAIAACAGCFPAPTDLPEASPSHPVDACALFGCNDGQ